MKKITIEFESKVDLEYHLEQNDKGDRFDDFDEYLRKLIKYGGVDELITSVIINDRKYHDDYFNGQKYTKPNAVAIVSGILQILREKLNSID